MKWPFDEFDMKPGSLHEVRASCTFAKLSNKKDVHIDFVYVDKGDILMSLGYEEVEDKYATHHFKFLYDEQIIFLPISVEPEEYQTEEEIVEAIQITLFSFVKPTSHGYTPPKKSSRSTSLIGDSRRDDDGYDEFH